MFNAVNSELYPVIKEVIVDVTFLFPFKEGYLDNSIAIALTILLYTPPIKNPAENVRNM